MTTLSQFHDQHSTYKHPNVYAQRRGRGKVMKLLFSDSRLVHESACRSLVSALLIAMMLAASSVSLAAPPKNGPFDAGKVRGSVFGSYSNNTGYLVLGGGIGYFVWKGVELGADSSVWFLADPLLVHISPKATYYLAMHPKWVPYVGVFYRHIFVEAAPDLDSVGGRLGIGMQQGPMTLSLGLVVERALPCDATRFAATGDTSCNHLYPEFGFGISF
jgi:hypothetical protein